jgi:hypothetical protein
MAEAWWSCRYLAPKFLVRVKDGTDVVVGPLRVEDFQPLAAQQA